MENGIIFSLREDLRINTSIEKLQNILFVLIII